MRALFCIAVGLLISACTRVAFVEPLGRPATSSEAARWTGAWTGLGDNNDNITGRVEQEPGSNRLVGTWTEDGKEKKQVFLVTMVEGDIPILWTKDDELKAYLPFRLCPDSSTAVAALIPDSDAVKKLVDESKLVGTYDKGKGAWMITKGDGEAALAGKEIWVLYGCMIFTRNNGTSAKSVASGLNSGH